MQRLLEEVESVRLLGIPEPIVGRIGVLLEQLPDPDEALRHLDRFRKSAPSAFEQIAASNTALRYLLGTFAYSRFLSDEVIGQPDLILQLADSGDMHRSVAAHFSAEILGQVGQM